MLKRLLRTALAVALIGPFGLQLARADIYTWVDASGTVNLSNLDPPKGANVTSVIRASPPPPVPRDSTAREALREAEVQVLAQQVRQLQEDVEQARREAAAQVEYRTMPAPPAMPYGANWPPPAPYSAPPAAGCDGSWMDCGMSWGPGIYPTGIVLLSAPNGRRFNPTPIRHRMAAPRPAPVSGGFRRH